MKKYTVIFDNGFQYGSHYSALPIMAHIETEDLNETLKLFPSTYFVFDGWLEDVRNIEDRNQTIYNEKGIIQSIGNNNKNNINIS